MLQDMKTYYQANRDIKIVYATNYYYNNKDKVREYKSTQEYKDRANELKRERRKTDKEYQIKENIRKRIWKALKGNSKSAHTIELLGCNIKFFKDWLEYNFYDGMDWDNYGTHWSLEHVRACDNFDLTDPEQQKICFSWKNTTCLRNDKNFSKNAKRDIYAELMQELKVKVYLSNIKNNE